MAMNVDIYRRAEAGHKFTYLLVPHGQPLPEEVTNVDWALRQQGIDVDEASAHLHPYEIDQPGRQIEEKGYAITSVLHQVDEADAREEKNPPAKPSPAG
jgi:hypothetical protein